MFCWRTARKSKNSIVSCVVASLAGGVFVVRCVDCTVAFAHNTHLPLLSVHCTVTGCLVTGKITNDFDFFDKNNTTKKDMIHIRCFACCENGSTEEQQQCR